MDYFIKINEHHLVGLIKSADSALASGDEGDMRHALDDIVETLRSEVESIGGPAYEALIDFGDSDD